MKPVKGITNKQVWLVYAAIVFVFSLGILVCAIYSGESISRHTKQESIRGYSKIIEKDAENIMRILNGAKGHLQNAWSSTAILLERGGSISGIEKLLEQETYRQAEFDEYYMSALFGIIDGEFVNGMRSFVNGVASKDDAWYQQAVHDTNQNVQLTAYTSLRSRTQTFALSRQLPGREGVIAIGIPKNRFKELLDEPWTNSCWMIVDTNKTIVSHCDELQNSEVRLDEQNLEIDRAVKEIIEKQSGYFKIELNEKRYVVFVAKVFNEWLVAKIVEERSLSGHLRGVLASAVGSFALFCFLILSLISVGYWKRVAVMRKVKERQKFRERKSHEVESIVNSVIGMNEIVVGNIQDKEIKGFAKNMQASLHEVSFAYRSLRDLSRLENGYYEKQPVSYELFMMLMDCYNAAQARLSDRNVRISLECDPDLPSVFWGDENVIKQIIDDILLYVIKNSVNGDIVWTIGYENASNANVTVEEKIAILKMTIREYESNINEENLDVELCLTRMLVDFCGGELIVKRRYKEGVTFMLSIPQVVLNTEPMGSFSERLKKEKVADVKEDVVFAPNARILVVDSEEMNLKVIRALLKPTKVQIDVTNNDYRCLEMISEKRYDLILLDQMLLSTQGGSFVNRMKNFDWSENKETPVVITISSSAEFDKVNIQYGIKDYIIKPFKGPELVKLLQWYLPKHLVLTLEDLPDKLQVEEPFEKSKENIEEVELETIRSVTDKIHAFEKILTIDVGLENCGRDASCYWELLQEFVRDKKIIELENLCKQKNWGMYRTKLHEISVLLKMIGALELAERIDATEWACREGQMDLVQTQHASLVQLYGQLVENIQEGLKKNA